MGRSPCCSKVGLNRGAWTALEDQILTDYIQSHGEGGWRNLPKRAGLKRCGKSCRLRWLNYLRPDIKRGNISVDEEELIIRLHKLLGNRWSLIAGRLPGRTDNEIKNYWNTNLGKKFKKPPSAAVATAAPQQLPVRTKATRCTKAVGEMTNVTRSEPVTNNVGAATPVRDNAIPVWEDSIHPLNFEAGLKSMEDDLFLTDFLNYSDFSDIYREFDCQNSDDNAQDLLGSSPPSICSDDSPGIMLSQRDMETTLEDWIVDADAFLFSLGGNSNY